LGLGNNIGSINPKKIPGIFSDVIEISLGENFSIFLFNNGSAYSFGDNKVIFIIKLKRKVNLV
jgi:hypothetical protein